MYILVCAYKKVPKEKAKTDSCGQEGDVGRMPGKGQNHYDFDL